jgi:hypothetical protein
MKRQSKKLDSLRSKQERLASRLVEREFRKEQTETKNQKAALVTAVLRKVLTTPELTAGLDRGEREVIDEMLAGASQRKAARKFARSVMSVNRSLQSALVKVKSAYHAGVRIADLTPAEADWLENYLVVDLDSGREEKPSREDFKALHWVDPHSDEGLEDDDF